MSTVAELAGRLGKSPSGPAYLWLAERLRTEISDGRVLVGARVPAERALAEALGVSRTTVSAAYTVLRAEGFLLSRPGSNTLAALPAVAVDRPESAQHRRVGNEIDLTVAALPAPAMLGSLAAWAASKLPPLARSHGLHPLGLPELRAAVATHLSAAGLPTSAEQVLITQGALHGWDLVLRRFSRPGQAVMTEQPSYPGVIDAALAHLLRIRPLPVTHEGWSLPAVSDASIVHVTPDHQNPTGFLATDAQRRQLLRHFAGTLIVIDETFADLSFDGRGTPMARLRRRDTITVGSLSKSVWAGLRIGWLRAEPELIRQLAMVRSGQDLATPVLEQLLALACFAEMPTILSERRATLRARRDALLSDINAMAPGWRVATPSGGMVLWADLAGASSTRLSSQALTRGVRITPGTRFSTTGTHDAFLRIPYTHSEATMSVALERLVGAQAQPRGTPAGRGRDDSWTA